MTALTKEKAASRRSDAAVTVQPSLVAPVSPQDFHAGFSSRQGHGGASGSAAMPPSPVTHYVGILDVSVSTNAVPAALGALMGLSGGSSSSLGGSGSGSGSGGYLESSTRPPCRLAEVLAAVEVYTASEPLSGGSFFVAMEESSWSRYRSSHGEPPSCVLPVPLSLPLTWNHVCDLLTDLAATLLAPVVSSRREPAPSEALLCALEKNGGSSDDGSSDLLDTVSVGESDGEEVDIDLHSLASHAGNDVSLDSSSSELLLSLSGDTADRLEPSNERKHGGRRRGSGGRSGKASGGTTTPQGQALVQSARTAASASGRLVGGTRGSEGGGEGEGEGGPPEAVAVWASSTPSSPSSLSAAVATRGGGTGDDSVLQTKPLVLIVDDSELNRVLARAWLEGYGIACVEAVNGLDALEKCEAVSRDTSTLLCEFAGILMDVQMPILNGLEASKAIRLLPKFERIPIVATTAATNLNDRCLASGMTSTLTKPFGPTSLVTELAKYSPPIRALLD